MKRMRGGSASGYSAGEARDELHRMLSEDELRDAVRGVGWGIIGNVERGGMQCVLEGAQRIGSSLWKSGRGRFGYVESICRL